MYAGIQSTTNLSRQLPHYSTESTPLLISNNTSLNIDEPDISVNAQSLLSSKKSLKDLIFLPEIGMEILKYFPSKDIVKIGLLNKEFQKNYLDFFKPQIAKNNIETHGKTIAKGELYFPLFLNTLLVDEKIDKRTLGLVFVNIYFREIFYKSRDAIRPTLAQTQKELKVNPLANMLTSLLGLEKFYEVYENIFYAAWHWQIDYPYLKGSVSECSIPIDVNLIPSCSNLIEIIDESIKDIENFKKSYLAGKVFDKKFPLNFLSMSILYLILIRYNFTPISAGLISSPLAIINLANNIDLNHKLPKSFDRLTIKTNILKNAVSVQKALNEF